MAPAVAERKSVDDQSSLLMVNDVRGELIRVSTTEEAISEAAARYRSLTIAGVDDKAGLKAVHAARMEVRAWRIAIDKRRKELKDGALKYTQKVDGEARRLVQMIEPVETYLQSEEDRIEAEVERIKQEKANAERLRLEAEARAQREAEEARLKAEREEIERQQAALRAEQERLEAQRREQEAEAARISAEKKRLADEEAARQRQAELERARAEAAERARLEAEEKARREAELAELRRIEAERKAAEEKARIEAMRPDVEKIHSVASLIRALSLPAVASAEARDFVQAIRNDMEQIAVECERFTV